MRSAGKDSRLLVGVKVSDEPAILGPDGFAQRLAGRVGARWDQWPLHHYPARKAGLFSPAGVPSLTPRRVKSISRDITHLHWVANGFLRVEEFASLGTPLVWSAHDMWAFTGGCHYTDGCEQYLKNCGWCPLLGSQKEQDLSREVWFRKQDSWRALNFTIVASSRWMAALIRASPLLKHSRIELIPNCLDPNFFAPRDRVAARVALGLPQDKLILLFGALTVKGDRRKGLHLLESALERLSTSIGRDSVCLAIMGASAGQGPNPYPFAATYLGVIDNEETLALAYAAADVFVAPSMEDNLPYTVMEAMSTGIPCVSFDTGGMPDLFEHEESGYLAKPFEVEDLAEGLKRVILSRTLRGKWGRNARARVLERFSQEVVSRQHEKLYQDLLSEKL